MASKVVKTIKQFIKEIPIFYVQISVHETHLTDFFASCLPISLHLHVPMFQKH